MLLTFYVLARNLLLKAVLNILSDQKTPLGDVPTTNLITYASVIYRLLMGTFIGIQKIESPLVQGIEPTISGSPIIASKISISFTIC